MKLKTLAIALTLALLCSMFALGIPASAKEKTIEFTIPLGDLLDKTESTTSSEWIGGTYDATLPFGGGDITKTLDGSAFVTTYSNAIYTYEVDPSGTFGGGIAKLYWVSVVDDFIAGEHIVNAIWEITFDKDHENDKCEGTLTFTRIVTRQITSWKTDDPADLTWNSAPGSDPTSSAEWTYISGTGDFRKFYFSTTAMGAAGGGSVFGTGSYFGEGSFKIRS